MNAKATTISISLGIVAALCAASAATEWTHTELGFLPGDVSSEARDINNRGQIVGYSGDAEGNLRPFLWEDGVMTDLGSIGGEGSQAYDINDRGQVVGGGLWGFLWEDGEWIELIDLNYPRAINNLGQVVGHNLDGKATLWDRGEVEVFGGSEYEFSYPNAINERGQVVGQMQPLNEGWRAFLWEGGEMIDLGTLGGSWSAAEDINNRGQIVGLAETTDGTIHAVMWEDGEIFDLGTLGGPDSWANAINERGQVAGGSRIDSDSYDVSGFLWDRGTMSNIGGRSEARGLNERGQAAGGNYAGNGNNVASLYEER